MDVRCPSCGTDYELDDARVPDTGLPVKCSKCGHVFRAVRPSANGAEPARVVTGIHSAVTEWMIRRTSGEMVRFRELTTLQRWIVERKVTRADEISKTGKKWEKLGNIPELAIFFQVIEGQAGAANPTEMPTEPAAAVHSGPPVAIPVAVKPTWPVDKPWGAAHGAAGFPPPPPAPTNPGMPAAPPRTGPDPLSETLPDPSGVFPIMELTPPAARAAEPMAGHEPGEERHATVRWDLSPNLPEDVREEYEVSGKRPGRDPLLPKRARSSQVAWVAIAAIAGVLAVSYVVRPAWLTGLYRRYIAGVPPAAIHSVDEAYAALLVDTGASIDTAVEKLEAALGLDSSYAAARAGLAEALAARADLNRDLADQRGAALAATPVQDPAPEMAAVTELRQKADADLTRAKTEAAAALEIDSAGLAANRAMLDVVRLTGEKNRIDQLAIVAHSMSPDDPRLSTIMGAIAMADSAMADRAQKNFEDALKREPRGNHAKYLFARLQASRGEKDKSIATLKDLLAGTATHERAALFLRGLEGGQPVAPTADDRVPNTDGRSPIADNRLPNTDGRSPTADDRSPTTATPTTDPPPVANGPKAADDPSLTFGEAMARGERLRETDKPGPAVRYYERAAVLNPRDPDTYLGIGFCRLDLRETPAAIAAFRKAIDLSPRFSDAHFGLAEAYRARGNKIYAIRYYKQYLDIAPHGADADVARMQLQRLEDDNTAVDGGQAPPPAPSPGQPEPPPPPAPPQ